MVTETTDLRGLIGGQAAAKLAKHRAITTVGDLLAFWPSRYRTGQADLGDPHVGEMLVAVARVESVTTRSMATRRGRMLHAVITDGRHRLGVTFFDARAHERRLLQGQEYLFAGEVTRYRGDFQLAHPGYATVEEVRALGGLGDREHLGLISIYRHVPGVHSWTITQCVRLVLEQLDEVEDPLPVAVRDRRGLLSRTEALRAIHAPQSMDDVKEASRRLRFEEAFVLQCLLGQRRAARTLVATQARAPGQSGLLADFDARLPFTLTPGQEEVSAQILAEMAQPTPMHRLLQGEVGSGKTVVAVRAMLAAVDAGGQAALLAPTEVLAAQHERTIRKMLGELGEGGMLTGAEHATRVTLLTGSLSAAAKHAALVEIAAGTAGIVIGTHALLEEVVAFDDLALVVVDEQHRFGVEQREALRAKGTHPPHVLVMTATPIPRTVAMTVFGDLETSTLRELPRGRQAIATHVVPAANEVWMRRAWSRVAEEVAAGRQAFVVCPRIGEEDPAGGADGMDLLDPGAGAGGERDGDDHDGDERGGAGPDDPVERPELASVAQTLAALSDEPALAGVTVAPLHGRMPSEEKEATMARFARGEVDVLVSTTVIEVGVDVPNATVMVILDADRFGVSQLHQLRGRVGRGGHPGLCLLVSHAEGEAATERLAALEATTDGFELARLDLSQRREGDILGARQHGAQSQLRHLSLLRDEALIEQAREDALDVLTGDPGLQGHPELAAAVQSWVDAEQAAFLERG